MRKLVLFIIALLLWVVLVWPFDLESGVVMWPSLLLAPIVALITAILFGEIFPEHSHKFFQLKRYFWLLYYLPIFFYYCILANLDVVYRVLHPKMPISPGIVKVKTKLKRPSAITALCNSITLTPGTLSVDLTDDGYIYVHWINVRFEDVEKATKIIVERFEKILERIFE